ncbi:MAG: hypothetical protein ABIJ56_10665 [Pseudomonadota bacterium]
MDTEKKIQLLHEMLEKVHVRRRSVGGSIPVIPAAPSLMAEPVFTAYPQEVRTSIIPDMRTVKEDLAASGEGVIISQEEMIATEEDIPFIPEEFEKKEAAEEPFQERQSEASIVSMEDIIFSDQPKEEPEELAADVEVGESTDEVQIIPAVLEIKDREARDERPSEEDFEFPEVESLPPPPPGERREYDELLLAAQREEERAPAAGPEPEPEAQPEPEPLKTVSPGSLAGPEADAMPIPEGKILEGLPPIKEARPFSATGAVPAKVPRTIGGLLQRAFSVGEEEKK